MEFLRQDFFNELIGNSKNALNQTFNLTNYKFSEQIQCLCNDCSAQFRYMVVVLHIAF